MKYVVAYDIESDGCRAKVSACLQTVGNRVQHSVFVCDAEISAIEEVVERCRRLIDPETDSLYIFRQCDECWDGVGTRGQAHPPERVYFWAVM